MQPAASRQSARQSALRGSGGLLPGSRQAVQENVGVPLILVGGIRSYTVAERLIEDGMADYISLSRPFIREPHLVARWKSGNTEKSACRSCNMCFRPPLEGPRDVLCCRKTAAGEGVTPRR